MDSDPFMSVSEPAEDDDLGEISRTDETDLDEYSSLKLSVEVHERSVLKAILLELSGRL